MEALSSAFLSASFEALFKWLNSQDLLRYLREDEVLNQLEEWKNELHTIHAVLEDAEEKQITENTVKLWLSELRDLAYDMEDVLDELNTEAQRRKCLMSGSVSTPEKVSKCTPGCFAGLTIRPSRVRFNKEMLSRINAITARLGKIVDRKNQFQFVEGVSGRSVQESERLPAASFVGSETIFGREKAVNALVDLVKGEGNGGGISVIPIVGMGGVGKTTLAQLVFNDSRLEFELKVWVSVGEDFNVTMITKTVLQKLEECTDSNDLNLLQEKVRDKLSGKRFLLVLDDVWNESYDKWIRLRAPFDFGAPGSKIIVRVLIFHFKFIIVFYSFQS